MTHRCVDDCSIAPPSFNFFVKTCSPTQAQHQHSESEHNEGMTELLCHQNTENPILSTMLDLLKLMDIHSVSWIPLIGEGAWTVEKMDLAFIAALSLVGSLFFESVISIHGLAMAPRQAA